MKIRLGVDDCAFVDVKAQMSFRLPGNLPDLNHIAVINRHFNSGEPLTLSISSECDESISGRFIVNAFAITETCDGECYFDAELVAVPNMVDTQ